MKLLLFLIFLFVLPAINAELFINEVMYDPEGKDNNNEFIEIYTDSNLSGFIVADAVSEDVLQEIQNINSNYSIIVEDEFSIENTSANIYSVGAAIGNNLNNDRDIIVIKDLEGKIIDVFSYTKEFGANNNGKSLCRIPDKTGQFKECKPSLGSSNQQGLKLNIKITEILPDPVGDDNAVLPDGEWIELHNEESSEIDLSGFYIEDEFGRKLYISGTNVQETTKVKEDSYLVVYANGFTGLLNNEGFERVILHNKDDIPLDSLSYGSTKEGVSWSLVDKKWFQTQPTPGIENPKNEDDVDLDSRIDIANIYLGIDDKAKWGDSIRVKVNIYKGSTSKNSVQAWIFKDNKPVSKRTSFDVHKKFETQTFTIPIQIDPNCKGTYKDDQYTLIFEGLDTKTESKIKISGINKALCEQASSLKEGAFTYELIEVPSIVQPEKNFDTKIKITNNLDVMQKFFAWNQVKNNKKTVSKKDKKNAIALEIPPKSSAQIQIDNVVENIASGVYKLDVNILQENKKIPKRLTTELQVQNTQKPAIQEQNQGAETNLKEDLKSEDKISNNIILESSSKKQKKITPYLMALVISILTLYGIFRR